MTRAATIAQLLAAGIAFLPASAFAQMASTTPATTGVQTTTGVPNAMQGFSQNREKPVHIESATLEVRDKDRIATFSGDVRVVQGDTTMRCKSLVVYYDQDSNPANMKSAQPSATGQQQQIRKLEAHGGVVVTQKDQTATGESAIFEMRNNTVTLNGNVLVTQGQNVLRGDRLVVDLTSGVSRVESGKTGQPGRVQGLFLPSGAQNPAPAPVRPAAPVREAPRARPAAPQGLY